MATELSEPKDAIMTAWGQWQETCDFLKCDSENQEALMPAVRAIYAKAQDLAHLKSHDRTLQNLQVPESNDPDLLQLQGLDSLFERRVSTPFKANNQRTKNPVLQALHQRSTAPKQAAKSALLSTGNSKDIEQRLASLVASLYESYQRRQVRIQDGFETENIPDPESAPVPDETSPSWQPFLDNLNANEQAALFIHLWDIHFSKERHRTTIERGHACIRLALGCRPQDCGKQTSVMEERLKNFISRLRTEQHDANLMQLLTWAEAYEHKKVHFGPPPIPAGKIQLVLKESKAKARP